MSSVLEYIEKNPKESQRLLGLKYEQLKQLLGKAIELHNCKIESTEKKKVRIIKGGGGRRPRIITIRTNNIDTNLLEAFYNFSTSCHSV